MHKGFLSGIPNVREGRRFCELQFLPYAIVFSLSVFFSFSSASAQQRIDNVVFEGAGIRGIAYSGALHVLQEKGILANVQRVGGTSAGAITAMALSVGYTPEEIESIIGNTSFSFLNDGRWSVLGGILRIRSYFGWYRGRAATRWLGELLEQKTGNKDITFAQLKQQGYKDLYVTGTCLNKQSLVVFSAEHYPAMKVKDAVRISMGIPLYFEAIFLDSTGSVIHHPKNKKGLDVFIDGGFVANYPIHLFDSTKYFSSGKNGAVVNPFTLGFRIDPPLQAAQNNIDRSLAQFPTNNLKQYLSALYNISIEGLSRPSLTEADWQRTVSISDAGVSPRIRKLKRKVVRGLVRNGSGATENYFAQKHK